MSGIKLEPVRCFICGIRIGKGNHPAVDAHQRIEKLVSVNHTVQHSSTIISDILSRILNETVMREETICRICFNLLNDIDYHLKEAQEKTDEITNKFLDKQKDPLNYRPHAVVTAGSNDVDDAEAELAVGAPPTKQKLAHNKENLTDVQKGTKRAHGSKKKFPKKSQKMNDTDSTLTEDEMSVNTINKNKAKLLSHVLNPNKKMRKILFRDSDEELSETEEVPVKLKHKKSGNLKSKKGKSRRHKRKVGMSDYEDKKSISQVEELTTVNMDELTDLFSKPSKVFYAKKSTPEKDGRPEVTEGATLLELSAVVKTQPEDLADANSDQDRAVAETAITCNICFKTFKKEINLQLHKEKVHEIHEQPTLSNVPETHRCSVCTREFTNSQSLAAHAVDHVTSNEVKIASKKLKTKESTSSGNSGPKATCPICSKTFQRVFNMKTHINRVHSKVKPYSCSVCDKTFATNSDLKQHLVVHGQGKTFTCETCGREFSNRDSIILHRKQHTQQKTHFCPICKKGFYKASCLNRHLRSHSGSRPYSCQKCNKTFSQSTTLKSHLAKCKSSKTSQSSNQDFKMVEDFDSGDEEL